MLEQYGSKVGSVHLRWHAELSAVSLLRFVRRQDRLTSVHISRADVLLPCLFPSMGNCLHYRHLLILTISSTLLPFSALFILGGIIEDGDVSLLKELRIQGTCDTAGLIALIRGFRRGACPHLHTMQLPFYETELCKTIVADVLEERRRSGTCQGLKRLEGDWLHYGSVGAQARLLRVCLR